MKKIIFFLLINHILYSQNVNVVFRSSVVYPAQTCANVGGYVDSLGNEYALVGASLGLSIVNVTDPDQPFEVAQIPGPDNLWREVKVYKKYAYVTTEGGGGLQIIDLSQLPSNNIPYSYWTGSGAVAGDIDRIHTLHIDTVTKYVYLYGCNISNGGAYVADLTNPLNPVYVGNYDGNYVHDGYVRNDTMYAAEIYNGTCSIVDFTDKSNPIVLQSFQTPGNFTHNTWLSDNGKTLFTTDEVSNSFLTAYDISNFNNITEVDRIQSNPGSNSVVHNTHILNDYAVTSWYKDGFTIVDAHRPTNLVQVGNYDTYNQSGSGFAGAWGVYPFLPSGNVLVSSMDGLLYILTPTYVRACYLEGLVTDNVTGNPLNDVQVQVSTINVLDSTKITGQYATGSSVAGTYNVTFSKPGYISQTINNVQLINGVVTNVNVQLVPSPASINYNNSNAVALLYPNPFSSSFQIKFDQTLLPALERVRIQMVNGLGEIVIDKTIANNESIALGDDYPNGFYFIKIFRDSNLLGQYKLLKIL